MQNIKARGIQLVIYIDDIFGILKNKDQEHKNFKETRLLLELLGLVINTEKGQAIPAHTCQFLGLIIDTKNYRLIVSEEKRKKNFKMIQKIIKTKTTKICNTAQLIGTFIAVCLATKYGFCIQKGLEEEHF